jgi:cytochrome c oxidase accessory protein FixG
LAAKLLKATATDVMTVRLPILDDEDVRGSILADGHRKRIVPADVKGRFHTARTIVFAILIAVAAALPWIRIHDAPAVFLDVDTRRFFLFGLTLNAQDTWLAFFVLSGAGFALVYATALAGRAWCGWACPQTVLLDGVFRRIERLVEGPRNAYMRRDAGTMTFGRGARKVMKHLAFAIVSIAIAHVVLSYFVSLPAMFKMVRAAPGAHPEAFAWTFAISAALYGNFAFFREQLCVVLCPYGRLQSVLLDEDSLVVGYDEERGEPRGKKNTKGAGDCVDCARCVQVCPTGIDIRDGLQMDCIACTACIDACDDVMDRLGRSRGLIRYDSPRGLAENVRKFWRPRIALYTVLLVAGGVAATLAFRARTDFEANVVRLSGAPFVIEDGIVRNGFEAHLVNKSSSAHAFDVRVDAPPSATVAVSMSRVVLDPLAQGHVSFFVTSPRGMHLGSDVVHVTVTRVGDHTESKSSDVRLLGVAR